MGDIQNAEAVVVSKWAKATAWVKAHIPHSIVSAISYVAGKIGVIGAILHFAPGKFY